MENNTDVIKFPSEKALHVLYQSSNTYVIPTGVSIYSLLKNNTDIDEIHIHVINDSIAEENVKKLERIAAQFGRKIEWIDGKTLADYMERCNLPKFNGAYTTYLKIFAPEIIRKVYPQVKNLLYIDSDTIVVGSLKDISNMDIHENIFAAAYEIPLPNEISRLGLSGTTVNAGIILFDLWNWHNNGCEETIKEKLSEIDFVNKLMIADQDVFNLLYYSRIQRLPIQYNLISNVFFLRPVSKYVRLFHIPDGYYSDEEVEEAVKNPVILHYIDYWTGRPWDEPNANPFSGAYHQYKNEILPDETVTTVKATRSKFRKAIKCGVVWLMHHVNFRRIGEFMSVIIMFTYNIPGSREPSSIEAKS